jgi:hypothetical protein
MSSYYRVSELASSYYRVSELASSYYRGSELVSSYCVYTGPSILYSLTLVNIYMEKKLTI